MIWLLGKKKGLTWGPEIGWKMWSCGQWHPFQPKMEDHQPCSCQWFLASSFMNILHKNNAHTLHRRHVQSSSFFWRCGSYMKLWVPWHSQFFLSSDFLGCIMGLISGTMEEACRVKSSQAAQLRNDSELGWKSNLTPDLALRRCPMNLKPIEGFFHPSKTSTNKTPWITKHFIRTLRLHCFFSSLIFQKLYLFLRKTKPWSIEISNPFTLLPQRKGWNKKFEGNSMDLHSHTTPIFFWRMGEWFFRSLWERGVWRGRTGGFLEVFPDKFRKWIYKPNAEAMGRGIILAPWPRLFFRFSVGPEGVGKPPLAWPFFVGGWGGKRGPFLSRKGWRCPISRNKFEVWSSYHHKPAKCGTKGWQGHWFIISFSTLKHFFSGGKLSLSSFFETVVCQLLFLEDIANFPSQPRPYPLEKTRRTLRCPKFRTWTRGNVPSAPGQLVFVFFLGNGWNSPSQKHWMPGPEHLVKWSASFFVFFSPWSRNQMYQDYEKF